MKNELPIYSIKEFNSEQKDKDFYANYVNPHVKGHHFTNLPHKHDFYLVILFTKGKGFHEVDFERYDVTPGSLFILKPGEMHYWELSDDVDGYVFFHSRDFYDKRFASGSLKNYEFYASLQNSPCIEVGGYVYAELQTLMLQIVLEHGRNGVMKWEKIHALVTLVYINISREYEPTHRIQSTTYLQKVRKFEDLIESNFKTMKFASEYASLLNISEKHLNRITKACFNKTSTQLIAERILLEAKRMLTLAEFNVNQISEELGFSETSYFIRFFKKHTGGTPLNFLNTYTKE